MKKIMDKLFNTIKFDKKYVFFCLILILIGIITGSFFIVILKDQDKNLIIEYIQSFVDTIKNNNFDYIDTLKNTLITNYITVSLIFIIGFTTILFPINIIILFYKSFIIGFCLASFILTFGVKGLLLSIVYIFPHLIINIFLFSIFIAFTLKISLKMIKYVLNKKDINMRGYFSKYIYTFLFILILITFTSLYETFITPYLLKLIVNII